MKMELNLCHLFELHGMLRCQSCPPFIDNTCRGKLNLTGRYLTPLTLPSTTLWATKGQKPYSFLSPFDVFVSSFRTNN